MMTFKKLLLATAALFMLLAPVSPATAREVITKYDVDIRIDQDSSMTVTENITAIVENIDINRGIIRVFPVLYTDERGREVRVGFSVLDAKIDGKKTGTSVSSEGRYREVRIGDPNVTLTRGIHTFTITYKTTRQLGFFENHDELYWNVTGSDWEFPILSASCRVALPGKGFGEGFESIEWYTGAYGQKGSPEAARRMADNSVITTKKLSEREGFTVVFTWPKGLVTPPPPRKGENLAAMSAIGATVLLAISLWMLFAIKRWGKNPPEKATIPLFYPPDGISPGYSRFVYKGFRTDQTAFAAALLGLAVKGAIRITEKKTDGIFKTNTVTLKKEEEPREELSQLENNILKQLFPTGKGSTLTVKKSNRVRISNASAALSGFLYREKPSALRKNFSKILPAVGLYILGIAALYPFSGEFFPKNMVISFFAGVMVIIIGLMRNSTTIARSGLARLRLIAKGLVPAILVGSVLVFVVSEFVWSFLPSLLFIAAAGVISATHPLLTALTQKGSDLMDGVEGLRLYMVTAETARLEMLNPPKETPMLFERLLPYALALDAAKTWANRFEKILTEAQYEPTWYVGPSPHMFITRNGFSNFANNLQSQMTSSMQTPSSSSSSSSGSGGGGFSGGGGGGGGGRGW